MQMVNFALRGVSLHLLLKSTPQWSEGLWLPKVGTNQVIDLQKTKPICIPRLLYWGQMTRQLGWWVRIRVFWMDQTEKLAKN